MGSIAKPNTDSGLLDGSLEDVPEVSTKIIRVFLSSTFSGKYILHVRLFTSTYAAFRIMANV